jgi:hypothetical protein
MSDLQEDIVAKFDRNPDADISALASMYDCSESYVRETLNEYRPQWDQDPII